MRTSQFTTRQFYLDLEGTALQQEVSPYKNDTRHADVSMRRN